MPITLIPPTIFIFVSFSLIYCSESIIDSQELLLRRFHRHQRRLCRPWQKSWNFVKNCLQFLWKVGYSFQIPAALWGSTQPLPRKQGHLQWQCKTERTEGQDRGQKQTCSMNTCVWQLQPRSQEKSVQEDPTRKSPLKWKASNTVAGDTASVRRHLQSWCFSGFS